MDHKIIWSPNAVADLDTIAAYIARDSETYAAAVVGRTLDQVQMLARFPRAGRVVPEFELENVRELIVYSYRVIYRVAPGQITIAAVIHGARQLTNVLPSPPT